MLPPAPTVNDVEDVNTFPQAQSFEEKMLLLAFRIGSVSGKHSMLSEVRHLFGKVLNS